jgi:hypothetical protein
LSVYLSEDGQYLITPAIQGKISPLKGWRVINNETGEVSEIFSSINEARIWATTQSSKLNNVGK